MGKTEFTIEVEKRRKDEDFAFSGLKMWHQECYGGALVQAQKQDSEVLGGFRFDSTSDTDRSTLWTLACRRCGASTWLKDDEVLDIVKTAIDGQKRRLMRGKEVFIDVFQKS
jgi:hypothetical protein